tara:strand:+ start:420 stop:953 length:534 start_codon:yes stop_codon:yes gene_type:complete
MKKLILNRNKGTLFWITGLSGSGKTSIAKEIFPSIKKRFGPTILISGDQIREIFKLKKYNTSSRLEYGLSFSKLAKFITDQNINIILNVIGMYNAVRKKNKTTIRNYIEIYIEADLKKVIKIGKKKIYKHNKKNIVGKDIKAELPKRPNIIIKNDFSKNIKDISSELIKKINNIVKK